MILLNPNTSNGKFLNGLIKLVKFIRYFTNFQMNMQI